MAAPDQRTDEDVYLVSHTHWDREWYRTFQSFRARLVDAVDELLDLLAEDPGYRFVLDGQAVVLEDYLAIRPDRRPDLEKACREGRLGLGPWYVQPDSLLPSGEAHIRNLLEGRRVVTTFGPPSRIAYTPDSFGHPATFPMLFAGFGLSAFVYWRGNPDMRPEWYRWVAPDGTALPARQLRAGYFGAAGADPGSVDDLARLAGTDRLLMNGFDHALPDRATAAVAAALAERLGVAVHRVLLDEAAAPRPAAGALAEFSGELLGGREANLLPGVWSARLGLKLRNRACERALEGWAEPWSVLARAAGGTDERPALRLAWRALLLNQAHDSIGGCSIDAVHEQMLSRYDEAEELADQTTGRALERIAGLGPRRLLPAGPDLEIAVFNPSPRTRTDVVRIPLDGYPAFPISNGMPGIHPLLLAAMGPLGYEVDGVPVRVVESTDTRRVRVLAGQRTLDLELVGADIPAFGYRRLRLTPATPTEDEVDGEPHIEVDGVAVHASGDGTLSVTLAGTTFHGLFGLEDAGDRGDSYDHDPVGPVLSPPPLLGCHIRRLRHPGGIQILEVRRTCSVPAGLAADRRTRSTETAAIDIVTTARVAPGLERVDVTVEIDNRAGDHRLRLLFPTGRPAAASRAATTLGVMERSTAPVPAEGWLHPAVATFPQQGWVAANGLTVAAPGLPEAEVTPEGVIAITAVRAVGWLARFRLHSRPVPAGPEMPAPGAQCQGRSRFVVSLLAGADAAGAREAELGLRAVFAGTGPLVAPDRPLLEVEPSVLTVSALKPAEHGDGAVLRLLNPTAEPVAAVVRTALDVVDAGSLRLDEEPGPEPVVVVPEDGTVSFTVPGHGVRTLRLGLAI